MKFEKGDLIGSVFILILIGFIIGSIVQWQNDKYDAIQHGAAHFDAVTGNFEWNK